MEEKVSKDYQAEKRCCTICDAKKRCHVCGDQTLMACSDCRINFGATVYVCGKRACREEHERKCYGDKQPPSSSSPPSAGEEEIARALRDACNTALCRPDGLPVGLVFDEYECFACEPQTEIFETFKRTFLSLLKGGSND